MNTLYLSAEDPKTPAIAANIIMQGGLVAIPTETVYGLGANGLDEAAVAKIFEAKGRPQDNPLILHISGPEQIELFCHHIPQAAYDLAEKFWPGPLTLVLPARKIVPQRTTANLNTVAVRCPDSAVTREIIRLAGVPLAAPSANISGKPSTTTAKHVKYDHDGKIDAIVDGGPCRVGVESTILDLSGEKPRLLRPGGITPEQLSEVVGEIEIDKAVTSQLGKDDVVRAPGMKYRHYAPAAPIVIVSGSRRKAAQYIHAQRRFDDRVLCFEEELPLYADCNPLSYGAEADVNSLSAGLFAALRELDDRHIHRIFARCPVGGGVAYAIQNRLKKAAAFHIVDAEEFPTIIGITGGTGSGKTTLLNLIREKGGTIFDCDEIYHQLLESSSELNARLYARFPDAFEEGKLDRKALGSIVFSDPQALEDLNALSHGAVKGEILHRLNPSQKLAAIDAIALMEGKLGSICNVTVAVTAPAEDRVRRIMTRDGISENYARARIAAQHDDEWFRQRCDYVLTNNADLDAFEAKCLAFLSDLGIV